MLVFLDTLDGQILDDNYRIERFLQNGNNCMIFQVTNIKKDNQKPMVAKIRETCPIFLQEIEIIDKLQSYHSMTFEK